VQEAALDRDAGGAQRKKEMQGFAGKRKTTAFFVGSCFSANMRRRRGFLLRSTKGQIV